MPDNSGFNFDTGDAPLQDLGSGTLWNRLFIPGANENVEYAQELYNQNREMQWQEYWYNQYQSPEALLRQGQAAGVNPHSIFANGVQQSNPVTAPHASSADISQNGAQGVSALTQGANQLMNAGESGVRSVKGVFDTIAQAIANKQAEKMNPLLLKQVRATIKNIGADTDLKRGELRQLNKMLPVLYKKAVADKDLVYKTMEEIDKKIEMYNSQINNIEQDTTLKGAQTGEVQQNTRNLKQQEWKMQFEKDFRDLFGIDISQGNISMLVQAILKGKGSEIMTALGDFVSSALEAIPDTIGGIVDSAGETIMNGATRFKTGIPFFDNMMTPAQLGNWLGIKTRRGIGAVGRQLKYYNNNSHLIDDIYE